MKQRIDLYKVAPKAYQALINLEKYLADSPLDKQLFHLVKMRASQINGCAYCMNMHSREALDDGETQKRLFLLDAWAETNLFSNKERAALALTEAMTLVSETHVPDEVYDQAAKYFEEEELAALIMAVVAINSWNRMAITSRQQPD